MRTILDFSELSQEGQLKVLTPVATSAALEFGFDVESIKLLAHSFNTSFEVQTPKFKAVIRVNTNSKKTNEEVLAEVQWLEALQMSRLSTPRPFRTSTGMAVLTMPVPEYDWSVLVTANSWLEGEVPGERPSKEQLFQLGACIAELHNFAENWHPIAPAQLPRIDTPLLGQSCKFLDSSAGFDSELVKLLRFALDECEEVFSTLRTRFPIQPIHSDLHTFNVMWDRGRLSIFDFDDSGLGMIAQDLPNSIFYMREDADNETTVLQGYQSIRELPDITEREFETLLVSRQLVLLNSLLDIKTSEEIAFLPTYLDWTKQRLLRFKETGVFELLR